MTTNQPKRLAPSLTFIIAGGVLGLVAIVSRPSDTQAASNAQTQTHLQPQHSEGIRTLMIDERPVLGELQSHTERTTILGGDNISYLDHTPLGLLESTLQTDSMHAEPLQLMLVDDHRGW